PWPMAPSNPLKDLGSMPGQVGRVWVECRVVGQSNALPLIISQGLLIRTILHEPLVGDHDRVVVSERPEPGVEEPMGVLTQGKAVPNIVVTRLRELVNVRRVDDA